MDSILIIMAFLLLITIFVVGVFGIVSIFRLHEDIDGPRLNDLGNPHD